MHSRYFVFGAAMMLFGCGGSSIGEDAFDGADASADDASPQLGGACDVPGLLGCQGTGQKLQLLCDGHSWIQNGVCAGESVCDARPGSTLGSCQQPVCTIDAFRCDGDNLERCSADGFSFELVASCGHDLCDAAAGKCSGGCTLGAYRCNGDVLESCNSEGGTFTSVKACGMGLCDPAGKECDECKPGDKSCSGAGVPRSCEGSGRWKELAPCSGSTPVCREGTCVASSTKKVTFPSAGSTLYTTVGPTSSLGSGGGGTCHRAGSYVEETFVHGAAVSKLDVSFRMSDNTGGVPCASNLLTWSVSVNGKEVGTYAWSGGGGDKNIAKSFTFAPIAPTAGGFTLRYEATSTVCSGGGAWNWYPGGTATMSP